MWSRLLQPRRGFRSSALEIEKAIERHTRISRDHLTPELRLHLLTADCPLYAAKQPENSVPYFEEPFWAIYWPGGQALARFLLDEGQRIFRRLNESKKSKRLKVLDVGAGCGAAGIAAKMAGAADVLANDIDEVACVAALKNARLNGLEIRASADDLLTGGEPPEPFDLVLLGDLLYDEAVAARLELWIEEYALPGGAEVYLADPGRHGLTGRLRRKLRKVRVYSLPENVRRENRGFDEAAVWKFLPRSER